VVDLVEIQTAYYMMAATGVLVAATHYIFNMRQSTKNRKAQLFMGIYDKWIAPEAIDGHIRIRRLKIDSFTEFYELYENSESVEGRHIIWTAVYFEGLGVLVKEGLIDVRLVALFLHGEVKLFWEKYGPFLKEQRVVENYPRAWIEAEYLYNRIIDYGRRHLQQG